MYDSDKLELASGNGEYADARALIPRDRVMRSLHPIVAALGLRAPRNGSIAGWWRRFVKDLFGPYRPELHYMRGPGPKWREKHGGARRR